VLKFGLRQKDIATVKVQERKTVGTLEGFQLKGEYGNSSMAWSGPTLYVSEFANARFSPPLPILDPNILPKKSSSRDAEYATAAEWKGKVESFGKIRSATAVLKQRKSTVNVSARSVATIESLVEIKVGNSTIDVTTWFEKGQGIVRQVQHTNGTQLVELELIQSKN
jgi:hypothetical protein